MNRHRVMYPRQFAFSRLASSRSIHDLLLDRPPSSESTEERDASRHASEAVGAMIIPTTARRVSLDEFFMHAMKFNEDVAHKSKRAEKYGPSSLPHHHEPKTSARLKGKQSATSHLSEKRNSRIYTTFPQLRFEGGIAHVVHHRALLVSFSTLNERVPPKKRRKKLTENAQHLTGGIQKVLLRTPREY